MYGISTPCRKFFQLFSLSIFGKKDTKKCSKVNHKNAFKKHCGFRQQFIVCDFITLNE